LWNRHIKDLLKDAARGGVEEWSTSALVIHRSTMFIVPTYRETWKAETMPNAVSNEFKHSLLHFHVCVHCGSAFRREEFGGRAVTSGILPCTKCGAEGPLNIEVRETDKPDSETQAFATK
jgi:hypothetical protein